MNIRRRPLGHRARVGHVMRHTQLDLCACAGSAADFHCARNLARAFTHTWKSPMPAAGCRGCFIESDSAVAYAQLEVVVIEADLQLDRTGLGVVKGVQQRLLTDQTNFALHSPCPIAGGPPSGARQLP